MWFAKKHQDRSYVAVAMTVIFMGAAVFAFGVSGWLINWMNEEIIVAIPSMKILGGIVIMSLGYIQLELGLLRDK
ncbi:MAG: hypothetical protein WEC83_02085 [Patescibacteria group bacterium]